MRPKVWVAHGLPAYQAVGGQHKAPERGAGYRPGDPRLSGPARERDPFSLAVHRRRPDRQAVPRRSSAARFGAQTTTGGVVVVAHSSAMGSSSAWPDAAWITARIHQDPQDTT